MSARDSRERQRERERSSIIVHTLAAQSRSGLGRTGQGWSAVGLGCAIIFSVIKTGLGLCYSTLSQRTGLLRTLGD